MLVLPICGGYISNMMCAVEMGSGTMTCIASFIKTGLGTQKLLVGDNRTDIQTQWHAVA
jgi:hypothetical protein